MKVRYFLTSLTRITDFSNQPFEVTEVPREEWRNEHFVAARVVGAPTPLYRAELDSGRVVEVMEGDCLIGAFGKRTATLEGVGDWQAIGDDRRMEALTGAGLFGKATSVSHTLPGLMKLVYLGHVTRGGRALNMRDFIHAVPEKNLTMPVVLLVGTSMSAGKTTTGRIIIHELKRAGHKVVGAKFTGAGRYRDILAFADAGADYILDFVDAGLPSTVVPENQFRKALKQLLARIAGLDADVLVAEAGASPLEPYNGAATIAELKEHICCTVLCASDPYAVLGVQTAFSLQPDVVTGPATNTSAAIDLVHKLAKIKALNIMDPASLPELRQMLKKRLPAGMM